MRNSARLATTLACAMGLLGLTGCESHPPKVAKGAPEYLHDALGGDLAAQAVLAHCYDEGGDCLGIRSDPVMACAWRGVRLASRSPMLTLADTEDYAAACPTRESLRQRAAIAQVNLSARIWGRTPDGESDGPQVQGHQRLLYPALDSVRLGVNQALARAGDKERLPAFGAPRQDGAESTMTWTSCTAAYCLVGVTPDFGGGVVRYRLVARSTREKRPQTARLAAAGLNAEFAANAIVRSRTATFGGICWLSDVGPDGSFVEASRAPCA